MKNFFLAAIIAALASACASVKTVQREISPDGTERITEFRARTFWDSRNDLVKARTTMTDKSQGVTVAGLDQDSSGTNATALVGAVVGAAVNAAVKSVVP